MVQARVEKIQDDVKWRIDSLEASLQEKTSSYEDLKADYKDLGQRYGALKSSIDVHIEDYTTYKSILDAYTTKKLLDDLRDKVVEANARYEIVLPQVADLKATHDQLLSNDLERARSINDLAGQLDQIPYDNNSAMRTKVEKLERLIGKPEAPEKDQETAFSYIRLLEQHVQTRDEDIGREFEEIHEPLEELKTTFINIKSDHSSHKSLLSESDTRLKVLEATPRNEHTEQFSKLETNIETVREIVRFLEDRYNSVTTEGLIAGVDAHIDEKYHLGNLASTIKALQDNFISISAKSRAWIP